MRPVPDDCSASACANFAHRDAKHDVLSSPGEELFPKVDTEILCPSLHLIDYANNPCVARAPHSHSDQCPHGLPHLPSLCTACMTHAMQYACDAASTVAQH